jgi:hypothetical integral membrane protein (TIGR02206 family)
MELFLDQSVKFATFSKLHFYSVFIPVCFAIPLTIFIDKTLDIQKKYLVVFITSLLAAFCVLIRMVILMVDDTFTVEEELPLHLCRLLALLYPFAIWYKSSQWINAFYFLVLAGTLQAIITPDLEFGPMHFSYFLYFILHNTLLLLPFLTVYLLRCIPDSKDLKFAFISGNVYMVGTLILNFFLGSNYFYTLHKPPGKSLLDLMGPWPVYLIVAEILALILFFIALLPLNFLKVRK